MTTREVLSAQDKVHQKNAKFQEALGQLGEAVEWRAQSVADRFGEVKYKLDTPRRLFQAAREKAAEMMDRVNAHPAMDHVKKNKAVYLAGAALLGGSLSAYWWNQRQRRH